MASTPNSLKSWLTFSLTVLRVINLGLLPPDLEAPMLVSLEVDTSGPPERSSVFLRFFFNQATKTWGHVRKYITLFGRFFDKNMCVRFELTSSARLGTCRSISWDPVGFFEGPWTVEVIGSSVVASLKVDPVGLLWRTVTWWRVPDAPAPPCCCCIRVRLRSAFFTHPDTVEWWMPYFRAVS